MKERRTAPFGIAIATSPPFVIVHVSMRVSPEAASIARRASATPSSKRARISSFVVGTTRS